MPTQTAFEYYAQVPNALDYFGALFLFPCNETLPDFHTFIDGGKFTVPGRYLNYSVVTEDYCLGSIQANSGLPFSICVDVFLKSVHAIYDESQATPRVGFAKKTLTS